MSRKLWRWGVIIPSVIAIAAITPSPASPATRALPCELALAGTLTPDFWWVHWYCVGNPFNCCR